MISKILTLNMLLAFAAVSGRAQIPSAEAQIRNVLARQQVAWNRGDTESFLEGYAPNTVFVSDKVTRGLDQVRARYQTHYPTVASMGKLTFSDVEVKMLGVDHAYVIGHWRLERKPEDGGDTGGVYTLIFQRLPNGWRIIMDHTS